MSSVHIYIYKQWVMLKLYVFNVYKSAVFGIGKDLVISKHHIFVYVFVYIEEFVYTFM